MRRSEKESFEDEEGSGENRTSSVMPRSRLDSWPVPKPKGAAASELVPLAPADLAITCTELSRALGDASGLEQIADRFVSLVASSLPGRLLALRLEDGKGRPVVAANAALRSENGEQVPLRLSRAAADLFALSEDIEVHDRHDVVCAHADHGFDLPILVGGQLKGALHVEYPEGVHAKAGELAPLLSLVAVLGPALERARVEREREAERSQLEALVGNTAVPAFLFDGAGRVVAASESVADLIGRPLSKIVGERALDLVGPEIQEVVRQAKGRADGGETIARIETRTSSPDGGTRVIWTVVPAHGEDGRPLRTVALGKDLTAVSRLEDQIVHTEKLATLGQLAAGVVHELNNPLTSISVYTDYLLQKGKRSGTPPGDLDRLARIAEAAARMLRFTRDLVTYARPSTEEPTAVAIGEILAQSAGFCEHVLREANVTLTLRAPASLPAVRGLRGQLQQVFVNLYTNAAHAIAERGGSGNIEVTATVAGPHVLVRVEDDGPGIRAEHRGRVFEPFFSTKAEGRGTGLGLSIVRNIVRLHGGAIDIESRHAESGGPTGTAFSVRLPIAGV